MRLLLFNLATDADDPVLGFTTRWIRALAERVELVHVVTMRAGRLDVPANVQVHSVGKEKGFSEPRRALEFYKILGGLLRRERFDVCFSHMMPLFTVMAAPLLKPLRVPIVTWYAHLSMSRLLPAAHWLSTRMIGSVPSAYPYRRDKYVAVGQGIDTGLFFPGPAPMAEQTPLILCVSRLSPVKDHPTLLKAVALLRRMWSERFRVVVVGGPTGAHDEPYALALRRQLEQLRIEDIVSFEPAVPMDRLPSWYRRSTVNVNMTRTGSGDKVVWEAMACGCPCIVANEGFRETLGGYADDLSFAFGDPEQLAARLKWVLSLKRNEREAIGAALRRAVESGHGLQRLADRLVEIFDSVMIRDEIAGAVRRA